MNDISQWNKVVKSSVNRNVKNQPKDVKEDFEQECFLRIIETQEQIEKIRTEQGPDAVEDFVYRICKNRITDVIRRNKKFQSHDPLYEHNLDPEPPSTPFGVDAEDLDEAIKQMDRAEQHVIRSIYYQNITEEDVAKGLGVAQGTVSKIKTRAVEQLREILESK